MQFGTQWSQIQQAAAYVTLRMFMFILIAKVLALLCVILLFDSIYVGKIIN